MSEEEREPGGQSPDVEGVGFRMTPGSAEPAEDESEEPSSDDVPGEERDPTETGR